MRKTVLGLAVGATALMMSTEAGACVIRRTQYVGEPVLANFVRNADSIVLARVTNATYLPVEQHIYGSVTTTYSYEFEILTVLQGDRIGTFVVNGSNPVTNLEDISCLGSFAGEEGIRDYGSLRIAREFCIADSGHHNWAPLFFVTNTHGPDGMGGYQLIPGRNMPDGQGGIIEPDEDSRFAIGCGNRSQSFAVGETYLVFLDAAGQPRFSWGLNLRMIRQPADGWLASVQYLIANQSDDYLPPLSPQLLLERLELVQPQQWDCEYYEMTDCASRDGLIWVRFHNTGWHDGIAPLPFHVTVEDGQVDFSGIPAQFSVEPHTFPLSEVLEVLGMGK